jgi:hypothetical protein
LTGTLVLMMRKTVEGFQRISGGEIQAAAGAEKACTASLGAFIHQGGTGHRNGRKFSQMEGFLKRLYAQIFRDPAKSRADDAGSILLACPVNPLVSMRKRGAALVKRGMQFFDQCDTLEAR